MNEHSQKNIRSKTPSSEDSEKKLSRPKQDSEGQGRTGEEDVLKKDLRQENQKFKRESLVNHRTNSGDQNG